MTQPRSYRVLLVDLAKSFGGAEVRVLTQAQALQQHTQACSVAAIQGSELHRRLQAAGLPVLPVQDVRGSPRMAWLMRDLIKQGGFQVVDAHNVQSLLWGHWGAVLAGARGRVATIHSDYGAEYPGLKGRLYEGVLRLNQISARQYINVTEVLQQKAERRGLGDRSTLIYNAVPLPAALPEGKNAALLAAFDLTPADFIVGIVARLKPVKGHTYLLEAFAQLKDLPHVKLLVVGDGPLRPALEAQAAALGITDAVRFAGFRQDVLDILAAVDVACLASLSEALPYAVLEAASVARPLLVTAVGGLKTLLTDQKTALLVPPQDASALAAAIRRLAENPQEARTLGQAAYQMVAERFSIDAMITQILQVYDQAIQ